MLDVYIYFEYGRSKPLLYTTSMILEEYWDYWVKQMIRLDNIPMITEKNCIEDWAVVNWAVSESINVSNR